MDLTSPSTLKQLMSQHNLFTKKGFGQHFLINSSVLDQIITAAQLQPADQVVEIGVGAGVLTQRLSQQVGQVWAFEVDQSLQPLHHQLFQHASNIHLQYTDFLKVNLATILSAHTPYKVVANLPYNVGSHIIDNLIKNNPQPQSITVLLQKEVAQKMTAQPPHGTYLSNFLQAFGSAQIICQAKAHDFWPAPKVDSAVLHLNHQPIDPSWTPDHYRQWSAFLHRGFASPRKKLNKAFPASTLQSANINPDLRPQHLTFQQWLELWQVSTSTPI